MQGTELIFDNKRYCVRKVGAHGKLKKGDVVWLRARQTDNFVRCVVDRGARFATITSMTEKQRITLSSASDSTKKYVLARHTVTQYGTQVACLAIVSSPADPNFRILTPISFYKDI